MEKSIYHSQAIKDLDNDHVETFEQDEITIMCAGPKEIELGDAREGSEEGRMEVSCLQHHLPPGISRQTTPFWRWQHKQFYGTFGYLFILLACLWIVPASAVLIDFQNCLSESIQQDTPLQLQFVPQFVDAKFNTKATNHTLQVTVWGNVTGSTATEPRYALPPANDSYWGSNDTEYGGKIVATPDPASSDPKNTTLSNKVNVLTYLPFSEYVDFCSQLENGACPLGPVFDANGSIPGVFPSFGFSNRFFSSYAFASFQATLLIIDGNPEETSLGCISANITPDMGTSLSSVITYIPAVILILVGLATAFAAIFSPWGSTDVFRWTTNYGRDADLLRLVTPGFGDCLQYIQFVALTGGLTLNYPGFYQPMVSKVSWSALMFNESFVSRGNGTQSLVDGIYATHGKYGLDILRQLVGMSAVDDVWAGMAIWLLVIIGVVLVTIQIGFFIRWANRHINKTHEEDLRAKNIPFSAGNTIRIVFNYFLLPIVGLSMFQLVVAANSPTFTVGLAVVMLILVLGFTGWLLYLMATTRPKSFLFDDLPTVLIYGSLYNTYSDHAAPFALIPILLNVIRGIAIGAVQPSGIAQIVLLAICEVINVMTLHAFRPFHSPTSMNAYHTFFSAIRFATILLMISFVPSLGVTEGQKGWIGYAILLMHAVVLILGFLLNAIQTTVEVAARMAGAGGDETGATRGGLSRVFGMRQLSKRLPRHIAGSRQSQLSNSAILDVENDRKSYVMDGGRIRSQSAGSTGVLLNRQSTNLDASSIDPYGAIPNQLIGSGNSVYTPTTPGEASTFSFLPSAAAPASLARNRGPILGIETADAADPYYRPPRLRRPTVDAYSPGAKSRGSWASADWAAKRASQPEADTPDQPEEESFPEGQDTLAALPPTEGGLNDPRRSKADYTTRESDFYYGVRGPALNASIPSRRIKTGPVDPTGIPASAAGWFKSLFGGKTKEKGKGFEVVRSSRMPPNMRARNAPGGESPPEGIPVATGGVRNGPIDSDDESVRAGPSHSGPSKPAAPTSDEQAELVSPMGSEDESSDDEEFDMTRISDLPPNLSSLEIPGGGIELPSRFPSKATSHASSRRAQTTDAPPMPASPPSRKPTVPRKSSKRQSQNIDMTLPENQFLREHHAQASTDSTTRLPFDRTNSTKRHSDISTKSGVTDLSALGHSRSPSTGFGNFREDLHDERPTSVGYVNQHSIRTVNPSDNPDFLGASAEVIDGGRQSGASSVENQRR